MPNYPNPTEPGYYWAWYCNIPVPVVVSRVFGELSVQAPGIEKRERTADMEALDEALFAWGPEIKPPKRGEKT